MSERLQKYLANAGVASRRAAEEMIRRGQVAIDGKVVTELGTRVDAEIQKVTVKGKLILGQKRIVYALHKPKGVICSRKAQKTSDILVTSLVPKSPVVYPVGRLDADSEGLIVMTNDGSLTEALTHPKHRHVKQYQIDILYKGSAPELSETQLTERLLRGIKLSDGVLRPDSVEVFKSPLANQSMRRVHISIHEGRNHVLRRTMSTLDYRVVKLKRIAIGNLRLAGLKPGEWRILSEREVAQSLAGTSQDLLP